MRLVFACAELKSFQSPDMARLLSVVEWDGSAGGGRGTGGRRGTRDGV